MFRFQHPAFLLFLILVPVIIFLYVRYLRWRRGKWAQLGDLNLVQAQVLGVIPKRRKVKAMLLGGAVLFAALGLANVQTGDSSSIVQRRGVDVFFALDVSKSMLARDVAPDRLTKAKQLIALTMDKMKGNRVGLVLFAGKAYLQVPLTADFDATRMMLENAGPDVVPTPGTVLGDAIKLSNASFSQKEKKYKAVVLISDGEDHDETALGAAKDAVNQGVIIHTIGIGSPTGTTFTDPETGKAKVDAKGNPVITKLNEQELINISKAGNGTYQLLTNPQQAADNILNQLGKMESKSLGAVIYDDYKSYFQYFYLIALLLFVISVLLPEGNRVTVKKEMAA